MATEWLERTVLLFGDDIVQKLQTKNVLVVGLGGVGAYAAEMIARAGVGRMTIVDGDTVAPTNLNRQLVALHSTLHRSKADILRNRLLDINPQIELTTIARFQHDEQMADLLQTPFDYVVDAIDTLSPKVYLIYHATRLGYPVVSSMGAGAKIDPTLIQIVDIAKTHGCKLARAVRMRLVKMGVRSGVKTVFSPEQTKGEVMHVAEQNKKTTVGTISYMPAIFGCYCASVALRDLAEA